MSNQLKPVYLLAGSDRPKVDLAVRRLRARFDPGAAEILSALQASGEDAVAACNSISLFGGGRRLVIVDDVDHWKADDAKAIAAYLESPAPESVLALVGDSVKRDSPLAKTCVKRGDVLVYDVVKKRLPDWVAAQFASLGGKADPSACRLLVELVGEDPYRLSSEIAKLASWAAGEPIGEREIELLSAGGAETPGYALPDAWGQRDVAALLHAAETMLVHSGDPRPSVLLRLAGLMSNHVGLVRACQALAAEGVAAREAAARLKRAAFPVEKAYAHARNFSEDELRDIVVRLAELDLALKGGSRLPGDLELERALIDITHTPGPAAANSPSSLV